MENKEIKYKENTINYKIKEIYFKDSKKRFFKIIYEIKLNNKEISYSDYPEVFNHVVEKEPKFQTKNQHFIPQSIQRNWSINKSVNKNNQKVLLSYFENDLLKIKKNKKIKDNFTKNNTFNIFFENKIFYIEEGLINFFESDINSFLQKIKLKDSESIEKHFDYFLSYTLLTLEEKKDFFKKIFKEINENCSIEENYMIDKIKQELKIKKSIKGEYTVQIFNEDVETFCLPEDWVFKLKSKNIPVLLDIVVIPVTPFDIVVLTGKHDFSNFEKFLSCNILYNNDLLLLDFCRKDKNKKIIINKNNEKFINEINKDISKYKNSKEMQIEFKTLENYLEELYQYRFFSNIQKIF